MLVPVLLPAISVIGVGASGNPAALTERAVLGTPSYGLRAVTKKV